MSQPKAEQGRGGRAPAPWQQVSRPGTMMCSSTWVCRISRKRFHNDAKNIGIFRAGFQGDCRAAQEGADYFPNSPGLNGTKTISGV